ncbi:hypothetical protein HDU76_009133, partial [Blyttiomyces sp. JEL0837]
TADMAGQSQSPTKVSTPVAAVKGVVSGRASPKPLSRNQSAANSTPSLPDINPTGAILNSNSPVGIIATANANAVAAKIYGSGGSLIPSSPTGMSPVNPFGGNSSVNGNNTGGGGAPTAIKTNPEVLNGGGGNNGAGGNGISSPSRATPRASSPRMLSRKGSFSSQKPAGGAIHKFSDVEDLSEAMNRMSSAVNGGMNSTSGGTASSSFSSSAFSSSASQQQYQQYQPHPPSQPPPPPQSVSSSSSSSSMSHQHHYGSASLRKTNSNTKPSVKQIAAAALEQLSLKTPNEPPRTSFRLEDFEIRNTLGTGSFGR